MTNIKGKRYLLSHPLLLGRICILELLILIRLSSQPSCNSISILPSIDALLFSDITLARVLGGAGYEILICNFQSHLLQSSSVCWPLIFVCQEQCLAFVFFRHICIIKEFVVFYDYLQLDESVCTCDSFDIGYLQFFTQTFVDLPSLNLFHDYDPMWVFVSFTFTTNICLDINHG